MCYYNFAMVCSLGIILSIQPRVLCSQQDADSIAEKDVLQELRERAIAIQGPVWSWESLFSAADVIVIANPLTAKQVDWNEQLTSDVDSDSVSVWSNRFRVLATIKGECKKEEIEMLTVKWKRNVIVLSRYEFPSFEPPVILDVGSVLVLGDDYFGVEELPPEKQAQKSQQEFMLFLRQLEDGTFESVTGQRFSGMGVRRLEKAVNVKFK